MKSSKKYKIKWFGTVSERVFDTRESVERMATALKEDYGDDAIEIVEVE